MRVYLCYTQADLERAKVLQGLLQGAGVRVFFDKDSIPGGDDWRRSLERELTASDAVVAVWSADSVPSPWVLQELSLACIFKKKIVPCVTDNAPLNPIIAHLQAIPWGDNLESFERRLFDSLGITFPSDDAAKPVASVAEAIDRYKQSIGLQFGCLSVLGRSEICPIDTVYAPLQIREELHSGSHSEPFPVPQLLTMAIPNIVLLGHPGAGKSTALRYLVHRALTLRNIFPMYVRIAELMNTDHDIEDFLVEQLKGQLGRQVSDLLSKDERFCRAGTLLLLDGLDEISDDERKLFQKHLAGFQKGHPDCRIAITSRFAGFSRELFGAFRVYDLEPLTDGNIEEYIRSVCSVDLSHKAWLLIRGDSRLLELARTPFLLAMMCASPAALGVGATQRAGLFRECIKYLLKEKDYEPTGPGREATPEEVAQTLEQALKTIAVRLFKLDIKDEFSEDEILFSVKELARTSEVSPRALVDTLISSTGLLQRSGKRLCFVHRTIWEYFVALGMQDEPLDNLLERAAIPAWEEPIRLYAGLSAADNIDSLMKGLWEINKGLTLRALTELPEVPTRLLAQLAGGLERTDRVRLMYDLEEALRVIRNPLDSKRMLLDTVRVIVTFERDCEVLYRCLFLLENMAKDQNCDECQILVDSILSSSARAERLGRYLSDPTFRCELVSIAPAEFIMGTNDKQRTPDEQPAHSVRLDGFAIMKYPVTNKLYYDAFPYAIDRREVRSRDDDQPVIFPTWYEAYMFGRWLGWDLPTEAEWEYACRAGGKDDAVLYDYAKIPEYAWFADNSDNRTHGVGEKRPNSCGLYDVLGNIREWCKDWFSGEYYSACDKNGTVTNPSGPARGTRKSLRGGGFDWNIANLVPTYRNSNPPDSSYYVNGFRLVSREKIPLTTV